MSNKFKRKGSWTLNPQGSLWSKNESNFGHKLLAKMGWKKGKGMGKNEDGITECIKVRAKDDNKGVGFTDNYKADTHSSGFNALLCSLNEDHSTENGSSNIWKEPMLSEISLEKRSKKFRNRLHYKKFIRGKDVCNYSKKDMESIFGHKLNDDNSSSTSEVQCNNKSGVTSEDTDYSVSNLSVTDYFAKKMQEKKEKQRNEELEDNLNQSEDSQVKTSKKKKSHKVKQSNKELEDNLNQSEECQVKTPKYKKSDKVKQSNKELEDNLNQSEEYQVKTPKNKKSDKVKQRNEELEDNLNQSEECQVKTSKNKKSHKEKSLKSGNKNNVEEVLEDILNRIQFDDSHVEASEINNSVEGQVEVPKNNFNGYESKLEFKIAMKRKRKEFLERVMPKRFKFNGRWIKSVLSKTDEVSRSFRLRRFDKPRKVCFDDCVSVRQIDTEPKVVQGKTFLMEIYNSYKYSIRQVNYEKRLKEIKEESKEEMRKARMEEEILKQEKFKKIVKAAVIKKKELNVRMGIEFLELMENEEEDITVDLESGNSDNSFNEGISVASMENIPENVQNRNIQQGILKAKKKDKKLKRKLLTLQKVVSPNQNQSDTGIEDNHDNKVRKKKLIEQQNEVTLNENVCNHDNAQIESVKSNLKKRKGNNKSLEKQDRISNEDLSNLATPSTMPDCSQVRNFDEDSNAQKIESGISKQIENSLSKTESLLVAEANESISKNSTYKNTNSWVESQKLALKMSSYKNIYTNLTKHSILSTANLHEIKGYGNW